MFQLNFTQIVLVTLSSIVLTLIFDIPMQEIKNYIMKRWITVFKGGLRWWRAYKLKINNGQSSVYILFPFLSLLAVSSLFFFFLQCPLKRSTIVIFVSRSKNKYCNSPFNCLLKFWKFFHKCTNLYSLEDKTEFFSIITYIWKQKAKSFVPKRVLLLY